MPILIDLGFRCETPRVYEAFLMLLMFHIRSCEASSFHFNQTAIARAISARSTAQRTILKTVAVRGRPIRFLSGGFMVLEVSSVNSVPFTERSLCPQPHPMHGKASATHRICKVLTKWIAAFLAQERPPCRGQLPFRYRATKCLHNFQSSTAQGTIAQSARTRAIATAISNSFPAPINFERGDFFMLQVMGLQMLQVGPIG